MTKAFWMLMITLGLWSCNSQSSKTEEKPDAEPSNTEVAGPDQLAVFIKDSTQYDPEFIKGIKEYKEPFQIIDNYIINGNDTTWFPEDFPFNKTVDFTAIKDHKKYMLSIARTSLTNLNYSFKLTDENEKLIDSKSGKAVLSPLFFLASEVDKDTQTGDSYGSYEYRDQNKEGWLTVRIGHGKDPQGKQRVRINYGFEDKNKQALKLEDCPTLRGE